MEMNAGLKLFLAALPILIVLVGLGVLKKPAMIVAPIAAVVSIIVGVYVYGGEWETVLQTYVLQKGVIEGLKTGCMLWGAFALLKFMQNTGAVSKIQGVLADMTTDKRAHVIIIAIFLGTFFEGAAGAGTPAAVCAPLLVGLGYDPMIATIVCLIANNVPVSWGCAGITTISTAVNTDVKNFMSIGQAAAAAGRIHVFGALVILFIAVWVVFGKKGFKGLFPYLAINSVLYAIMIVVMSGLVTEIVGLTTGMALIAFNFLLFKVFKFKINTPEEFIYQPNLEAIKESHQNTFQAFFPYLFLCIAIPAVRFSAPLATLSKIGFPFWISWCLFGSVIVGAFVLKDGLKSMGKSIGQAGKGVIPSGIAIIAMIIMAQTMNGTGMTRFMADAVAKFGVIYPIIALLIGVLGAFISGTASNSNVMFGAMHCHAATTLGINPIAVFGAQSAGGALGNMICPHNVIAVTTTTGLRGEEGTVMRRVMPAFLMVFVLYSIIAMLNVYVIYPNYPGYVEAIPPVLSN